jgi:hypothetical protein
VSRPAAADRGWLQLIMPRDNVSAPFTAEQLFGAIHASIRPDEPVQLLLTGHGTPGRNGAATQVAVTWWLRARKPSLEPLAGQLQAVYPDLQTAPGAPPLRAVGPRRYVAAQRWTLAADRAYPMKRVHAFVHSDPMAMTLGALGQVRAGESGALSVVLWPAPASFARHAAGYAHALATGADTGPPWLRAVASGADLLAGAVTGLVAAADPAHHPQTGAGAASGGPAGARRLPPDTALRVAAITEKAAQPAFLVTLRTGWEAASSARAVAGHLGLAGALGQFAVEGQNALLPAREDTLTVWRGILAGTGRSRERLVLGADELAGLLHPPAAGTVVPHLARSGARRRAPAGPPGPDQLHLADSLYRNQQQPVGVSVPELLSHAYVIGPSGTGKTTLLTRLVLALAETSTAALVLDPHGDLVRHVLASLPAAQLPRVDLVDLDDPQNLPSLNPLWLPTGTPVQLAQSRSVRAGAVQAIFTDLWQLDRANAPNLLHFLQAALAALIAAGDGCLAQLPRFLTDPVFRSEVVRRGGDPRVAARWTEFAALSYDDRSRTIRAILNKAADFDRNPVLGTVFGDTGPGFRLDEAMDRGRIVLVSLPRGLVAEGTVALVGSVLVTLAYQAALARERLPEQARPPVIAVIDEFQEFALSTFASVLTATRKYGLGLVVANQNLSRIEALSRDLLSTLLANVGTLVSFRTAPGDARVLAPYVAPFDAEDLTALAPFESYWRTPGPCGPQVIAAATRAPGPALRSDAEIEELARRLRVPGRPLIVDRPSLAPVPAGGDWPMKEAP